MAFRSGSYKTPPRWEHYHGGLGFTDKPMPVTQWRSPRRATMSYNKSGYTTRTIDMIQRNGVHVMESNSRAMLRKIMRQVGKRFPLVWAGEQAFDGFFSTPGTDLATPARIRNGMWESSGCTGPETVCELGAQPQWYHSSAAYCWNPSDPMVDDVAPGAIPHGFKWFWRCDLRGTEYEWYGAGWLWSRLAPWWDNQYGRDWPWTYGQEPKIPLIDPQLMPEAQPIDRPAIAPQKRPYWATPVAPGRGLQGYTAGNTAPTTVVNRPQPPGGTVFPPHVLVAPGPGEKERKSNNMPKWLVRGLNWALQTTEYVDVINAIADAFEYKKRRKPGEGKIPFIYRMWTKATTAQLQQAIINVILNELEDQIVGRVQSPITVPGVGTLRQVGSAWILSPWN